MELIIVMAVLCGAIGYFIDGGRGLALGALLGVIGLIISAILASGDAKRKES